MFFGFWKAIFSIHEITFHNLCLKWTNVHRPRNVNSLNKLGQSARTGKAEQRNSDSRKLQTRAVGHCVLRWWRHEHVHAAHSTGSNVLTTDKATNTGRGCLNLKQTEFSQKKCSQRTISLLLHTLYDVIATMRSIRSYQRMTAQTSTMRLTIRERDENGAWGREKGEVFLTSCALLLLLLLLLRLLLVRNSIRSS